MKVKYVDDITLDITGTKLVKWVLPQCPACNAYPTYDMPECPFCGQELEYDQKAGWKNEDKL